jgi:hypothetical protein
MPVQPFDARDTDRLAAWPVLLALAVALIPVLAAHVPPLLDYHNHLARQYILHRGDQSVLLEQWYRTSWHAAPYLAFDGIVQTLTHLMPVAMAGKVFVVLMLFLTALAPLALSWAVVGRITPAALLGLLFVYNETVTLGFMNYLFGIGFALCAAALWIRWRSASWRVRLTLFPIVSSLVFFSHLLGFVLYVLVIGSYELGRWLEGVRRSEGWHWGLDGDQRVTLASIILQCAAPLAIFAALGPSTASISSNTYGGLERKFELLAGAFGYLVPTYIWSVDRVLRFALPLILLGLLLSRRWCVDRRMRWPLAALSILFFAMPMELFSGWGADHRLLPALGLLFVGSLRPAGSDSTGKCSSGERWAMLLVGVLVALRVVGVTNEWRKSDANYSEYFQAFGSVPMGARMYYAFGHAAGKRIGTLPVYHLPTLVVASRDVYVPYLFASDGGGFTLAYRKEIEPLQRLSPGPVLLNRASPNWAAIQEQFDYFLLTDEHHFEVPVPSSLELVFAGKSVKLYRRAKERGPM